MGCILSFLACQSVSCCAGTACSCCGKLVPCTKSIATRVMYVVMFVLAAIAMYIFNFWSYKMLSWIPVLDLCSGDSRWCVGVLSAARVCFAVSVFHLIFAILMIRVKDSKDFRASIQDGWWLIKVAAIIALVVVAFFIPNEFFVVFGWITLFGAAGFILIQLLLLIEFAYTWAESWLNKYEGDNALEENKFWFWALMIATLVLYALSLTVTILLYVFFYSGSECWMNATFPTINILICALFSFLSIHPKVQEAHPAKGTGLLQAAVVTTYCTYLVYSAISSEPTSDDFQCNPFSKMGGSISTILTGAAFTIIAVCWSTMRIATKGDNILSGEPASTNDEEGKLLPPSASGDDGDSHHHHHGHHDDEAHEEDDEKDGVTYSYSFFHITFMLGTMYVFMLITNWQTVSGIEDGEDYKVDHGFVAVWVKLATSWLAAALYTWTLIAPVVLSNRDFS